MISRRCFCSATAAGLFSALAAPDVGASSTGRPYCRFSLKDGWTDDGPHEYITHKAGAADRSGVPQVIRDVRRALGVSVPVDVFIAKDEGNAFATVVNGGQKIIVADVDFLRQVDRAAQTQWGAIQVLSHELGHHIAGFGTESHRNELNADYWSGQALQRLGSARAAATAAILAVGSEYDTPSHPNKHLRAQVIAKGWSDAQRDFIDYSFCMACK